MMMRALKVLICIKKKNICERVGMMKFFVSGRRGRRAKKFRTVSERSVGQRAGQEDESADCC